MMKPRNFALVIAYLIAFAACLLIAGNADAQDNPFNPSGDLQARMGLGGGAFAGPICLPDGTANTPSWGWCSDDDGTGTGCWRSAADTIECVCNASRVLTIAPTNILTDQLIVIRDGARLTDNDPINYGSSSDYWSVYNSTNTRWEFWSTDIDGGGTDGILFSVSDGVRQLELGSYGTNIRANRITIGTSDYINWPAGATIYQENAASSDSGNLPIAGGNNERTRWRTAQDTFTFPGGGAASQTSVGMIQAGMFVIGATSLVITSESGGGCTSMDIGIVGVDTNLFADNVTMVDGDTTDNGDITASFATIPLLPAIAAQDVVITGQGGNCADLSVSVHIHYFDTVAPTEDP